MALSLCDYGYLPLAVEETMAAIVREMSLFVISLSNPPLMEFQKSSIDSINILKRF